MRHIVRFLMIFANSNVLFAESTCAILVVERFGMKDKEKQQARKLRGKGISIKSIAKQLDVSKSSVSVWVRDICLNEAQIQKLHGNSHSYNTIEKRRQARLKNEERKRAKKIMSAEKAVPAIGSNDLFFIGIALYWAEGSKTNRGSLEFSNSDPELIRIMRTFFDTVCNVPKHKYRGHVYLHPHLDVERAESFWSGVSGIPKEQFFKTSQQHNRASKNKKDSLPYGTFAIGVYDIELFLKMQGWMNGLGAKVSRLK